jgi:hypothetical protein
MYWVYLQIGEKKLKIKVDAVSEEDAKYLAKGKAMQKGEGIIAIHKVEKIDNFDMPNFMKDIFGGFR